MNMAKIDTQPPTVIYYQFNPWTGRGRQIPLSIPPELKPISRPNNVIRDNQLPDKSVSGLEVRAQ